MNRVATLMVTGILLVLAALAFTAGVDAQDSATRELRDRAEIEALMWRYVRALDTLNADAYAANFTLDGQFGATKGRDALKKMVSDLARGRADAAAKGEPRPPMYHIITNPYIQFVDRDHAVYRAYWMTVFGAMGQNTPPRVAAAGRSIDHLVRVNGQWLIQSRNVAPAEE